jgi:hypothetical protein
MHMDIMQNAQGIMDYINASIGGDGLTLDENGVASLAIDNDIICLFCVLEAERELVTTLYLGRVDKSDTDLLYEMMCGNYMGSYTAGGTIGIDAEEGLVALHQHFPLPVEEPDWIEEPLSALIGAARYWRDKIGATLAPISAGAPEMPMGNLIRV